MNYKQETLERINSRLKRSKLDVNTHLQHFAIISYKVPIEKIQQYIPKPFRLWTFEQNGKKYALLSAVTFKDKDFCFHRITKYPKFNFFQTNYRCYIIDERDQSHSAWFFGTTLGSSFSFIPKYVWQMPWAYGQYTFKHEVKYDHYYSYKMHIRSKQGNGHVDIESTGLEVPLLEGFTSIDQQELILTHPVIGYYNKSNKRIGTYEIWHPKIKLKEAKSNSIYFEYFEKLGLLTKDEMNIPHSILITQEIEFDILLPPRDIN